MLARTVRRCRETGVGVLDTEAIRLGPPAEPDDGMPDFEATLEAAAELGAGHQRHRR